MKNKHIDYSPSIERKSSTIIKKVLPIPFVMGVITALVTYARLESGEPFLEHWLRFYLIGLLIIAPIGLGLLKGIEKFIQATLKEAPAFLQYLTFGLLMAFGMGSLMTGAWIFSVGSFDSLGSFLQDWGIGIQAALPGMLGIALLVGLVIKPLIERKKKNAI